MVECQTKNRVPAKPTPVGIYQSLNSLSIRSLQRQAKMQSCSEAHIAKLLGE
jgi:hypothetical protein